MAAGGDAFFGLKVVGIAPVVVVSRGKVGGEGGVVFARDDAASGGSTSYGTRPGSEEVVRSRTYLGVYFDAKLYAVVSGVAVAHLGTLLDVC